MPRLTESWPGKVLGIVLAILWIISMSTADANACTLTPLLWMLTGLLLGGCLCIALGYKIVRLPLIGWLGILGGLYYLIRASQGFSLTDNWSDMGVVLGGITFYIAGIYCGQSNSSKGTALVLSIALILNLASMLLMKYSDISLNWIGRADIALTGPNTRNTTLFAYKNFACLFLCAAGMLLVWRSIWRGSFSACNLIAGAVGITGIVAAFFCESRVVLLVLPLMFAIGWILWLIISLYDKRSISWGIILGGLLLLTGACMAVYDFLFERNLLNFISQTETHLRTLVWEHVCRAAENAPLWGYGPGGAVWEIIHTYNEWQLPNAAHNEYLQLWSDYGLLGICIALLLLLLHVVQGIRALACDELCKERRVRTALSLLGLATLAAAAVSDYIWHSFALTAMSAFCCGALASPIPPTPSRQHIQHSNSRRFGIRAQGVPGRVLIIMCGVLLSFYCAHLANTLTPTWMRQWQYDSMVAQQATPTEQRRFLLEALQDYPHSRITDHIINLAPRTEPDWITYERGLCKVLESNPRQLFTATILAQILTKQQRFPEAEQVYRRYYPGDGPDNRCLSPWATFYAANLQKWGHHILSTSDDIGLAYSILTHAENIAFKGGYIPGAMYRSGVCTWTHGGSEKEKALQKGYKRDLQLLHAITPEKNDTWKLPIRHGEKPALYQRYQKTGK